ncbi:hypothetical protein PMAYCL1PPCAC_20832, partial [Pristionchus mayeri]
EIDHSHPLMDERELTKESKGISLLDGYQLFDFDFIGEDITVQNVLKEELMVPKGEPIDAPFSYVDQQFNLDFHDEFTGYPFLNYTSNGIGENHLMAEDMIGDRWTMEESDHTAEMSMKRKSTCKGSSKSKSMKMRNGDLMWNEAEKNELQCPECEYRSRSAPAWYTHLIEQHFTTPTLAGLLLRCDCGNESYSFKHSYECEISNFTLIRKEDRQIRRLTDPSVTPQCVLCEVYPKTPRGYSDHLRVHHKITLKAYGIYILCGCGHKHTTKDDNRKHDKKCSGSEFTLHELDQEVTPQCFLCEVHPKTPRGYIEHLRIHHKTTLLENRIYLICVCGLKYNCSSDRKKHDKTCLGRYFTLHSLDED